MGTWKGAGKDRAWRHQEWFYRGDRTCHGVGKSDRAFTDGGVSWVFLWKSQRAETLGVCRGCSLKSNTQLVREESGLVHQVTEHLEAEGEVFNTVDMLPFEGF